MVTTEARASCASWGFLTLALAFLGACGGSALKTSTASGGASGAAGVAGTAGVGGTMAGSGGVAGTARGGSLGSLATGGAAGAQSCGTAACPSIPTSCRKIVQDPGACCPTCTDTGCNPCPELDCPADKHAETTVGDCCPSCVANPPDPCLKGQQDYAAFRKELFDKYASVGCKNSKDCTLVLENNACAFVCSVPLPITTASNFPPNMAGMATGFCATCPSPARITCDPMTPSCVNGSCVAVAAD